MTALRSGLRLEHFFNPHSLRSLKNCPITCHSVLSSARSTSPRQRLLLLLSFFVEGQLADTR
ncbi:hypothetical protein, partial [Williamsia sp. DF01-3]|uniref:hypothetical protein n=1 Tax=Williamsia sp. DF01-3 TaxID=2934157 RepID=UPI001FF6544A